LDEAKVVQEAARQALAQAGVDASEGLRLAREPRGPLDPKARRAQESRPAAVEAVDPRQVYRRIAARKLRSAADAPLVVALLQERSASVVEEAAEAAGALRLSDAVGPLCVAARTIATGDGNRLCLREILAALGKIGDPEGVPVLLSALEHPDSSLRDVGVAALAGLGLRRASGPDRRSLRSRGPRYRAAQHLGERQDPRPFRREGPPRS
jgi:HEAT repeat protein